MAGSGVNVGGTAMLRTRRRDVSIKPNRRLDRKSSRGMIYENEELRLRTININAEVEQGQNDIKKLRRENEQLRREIWSLRDEYDKLEELVKNQSSQGSSDELEGRSGEEDKIDVDAYAEYSGDEDVVEEEEEEEEAEEEGEDGRSQEEDLENAENQKISSEKMNNSSMHRLHVEFDDLSVVDEEEELKKDREKKDSVIISNDGQPPRELDPVPLRLDNQENSSTKVQDQDTSFRYYPTSYDIQLGTLTAAERKYFNECPFVFPNPTDPNYPKMLMSPSPKMYNGQLTPIPNLDTPGIGPVDSVFGLSDNSSPSIFAAQSESAPFNGPSLPQRRNARFNNPVNFSPGNILYKNSSNGTPNSGESLGRNGWDFTMKRNDKTASDSAVPPLPDKPRHFFAPLPSKLWVQRSLDDATSTSKAIDTATSSSSEKTCSTVVSPIHTKGTADLYVNGGYPFVAGSQDDPRGAFLASQDLLLDGGATISRQSSNNPLVKSLSCQDLSSSDPQNLPFSEKLKLFNAENYPQKLITKSDNTLDNISNSSRPYKSQLNVTLRLPTKPKVPSSPDTPEIPKLPAINYRLFSNPFLQTFDRERKNYLRDFGLASPATRPLSIQVNETASANGNPNYPSVENDYARLLLKAPNQFRGFEETAGRPAIGFEVTSFEGPSPQTLLAAQINAAENDASRRVQEQQRVFQKMAYPGVQGIPRALYNENRVPAQTQTSQIDGDSSLLLNFDVETETQTPSAPGSPLTLRRKRTLRKERAGSTKDKRPLSPAAQRRKDRLRMKQGGVVSPEPTEAPVKAVQPRARKQSLTTSTSADVHDKNESRSSSSGQDSPKKVEQRRRVSLYFNAKKRPALTATKGDGRSSNDSAKDGGRAFAFRRDPTQDATTTNSERERTNSVSSRDTVAKGSRKLSTGSEKVPWCACWGNGCV